MQLRQKALPLRAFFKEIDKNMNKISYALGLGIGQQLKSMGIEDFNVQDFTQSICDVLSGATPAIPHREAQVLLNEYFDKKARSQAEGTIAEGKAFLEANATRKEVTVTKSGLQYEVLKEGTGRSPKATDSVRCHYEGTLVDGTVFDSRYKRGERKFRSLEELHDKPEVPAVNYTLERLGR